MADKHSKETRSYNMSQIRSRNTKPELAVRKFLFANGFRYRLHDRKLPGSPDMVLKRFNTIIFIHGCFWHAHENCRFAVMPKSNVEYWRNKIEKNVSRDRTANEELKRRGWNVITLWECELKKASFGINMEKTIDRIMTNQK